MKIKDKAIKELDNLNPGEVMIVYDLILSLKGKIVEQNVKKRLPAYIRVRNALRQCKGSMSEDILTARKDRI